MLYCLNLTVIPWKTRNPCHKASYLATELGMDGMQCFSLDLLPYQLRLLLDICPPVAARDT